MTEAHDRIATLINDLVQMQARCSYVDFADLRTLFHRGPDGPMVWFVGSGTARGSDAIAAATRSALRDLTTQINKAT